jgi:hypothetical protein
MGISRKCGDVLRLDSGKGSPPAFALPAKIGGNDSDEFTLDGTMSLSAWASFFLTGWGAPFTFYVLAQTAAIVFLRGRLRRWAAASIPVMALVLAVTIVALIQESNLWPIWLILASPIALVYLAAVLIAGFFTRRRESQSEDASAI